MKKNFQIKINDHAASEEIDLIKLLRNCFAHANGDLTLFIARQSLEEKIQKSGEKLGVSLVLTSVTSESFLEAVPTRNKDWDHVSLGSSSCSKTCDYLLKWLEYLRAQFTHRGGKH